MNNSQFQSQDRSIMDIENNSMIGPETMREGRALSIDDNRGTFDDMESILKGMQLDSQIGNGEQFSDQIVEKEQKEFHQTRKQVEDQDLIDIEDRIFYKLMNEDELKFISSQQQSQCFKCQKKFGMMNKKHQCKFCGNLTCQLHARKYREDPEKKIDAFKRICDSCEDKYLKRMINLDFQKKKSKYDKIITQLEEKQEYLIRSKKKRQTKLDELKQKDQELSNQFGNDSMKMGMKINRVQQEIKSLTEDYNKAKEKLQIIDDSIIEKYNAIKKRKENMKEKQSEEEELRNKILAIEQDIKETQYIVDVIEKKITENNLRIEKLKVSKVPKYTPVEEQQPVTQTSYSQPENGSMVQFRKHKTDQKETKDSSCGVKECQIF